MLSQGAGALPLGQSLLLASPGVAELDKCPSFLLPAAQGLVGLSRRSPEGWTGTVGSEPAPWAACATVHRLPAPAEGCPALRTAGLCQVGGHGRIPKCSAGFSPGLALICSSLGAVEEAAEHP